MPQNIFPLFGGWIQEEDADDESTVDVINPRAFHIRVSRGHKLGQTPLPTIAFFFGGKNCPCGMDGFGWKDGRTEEEAEEVDGGWRKG